MEILTSFAVYCQGGRGDACFVVKRLWVCMFLNWKMPKVFIYDRISIAGSLLACAKSGTGFLVILIN